jgi:hypothetical protein
MRLSLKTSENKEFDYRNVYVIIKEYRPCCMKYNNIYPQYRTHSIAFCIVRVLFFVLY